MRELDLNTVLWQKKALQVCVSFGWFGCNSFHNMENVYIDYRVFNIECSLDLKQRLDIKFLWNESSSLVKLSWGRTDEPKLIYICNYILTKLALYIIIIIIIIIICRKLYKGYG